MWGMSQSELGGYGVLQKAYGTFTKKDGAVLKAGGHWKLAWLVASQSRNGTTCTLPNGGG